MGDDPVWWLCEGLAIPHLKIARPLQDVTLGLRLGTAVKEEVGEKYVECSYIF